jgi:hypothetical protein
MATYTAFISGHISNFYILMAAYTSFISGHISNFELYLQAGWNPL